MKKITLNNRHYVKVGSIKRTSIRLGIKGFAVGPSVIHDVDTGHETQCVITRIDLLKVGDLDHRHAIDDGFHSLGELMVALRKIYGANIKKSDHVTVVKFEVKE